MSLEGVVCVVKKAQKFIVLVLMVAAVCSALPAMAWWDLNARNDTQNLGIINERQWWISDRGIRADGTPYAILWTYYPHEGPRETVIEALMTQYNLHPDVAGALYGTARVIEYTPDLRLHAEVYTGHFSQGTDNLIHETIRSDSEKLFAPTPSDHPVGRAAALISRERR